MAKKQKHQAPTTDERLERELKELRSSFYPNPPAFLYQHGQRVVFGGFNEAWILDSLENGKYYKVQTVSYPRMTNAGMSKRETDLHYVAWVNLTNYDTAANILDEEELPRCSSYTTSIEGLIHTAYAFGIDMEPSYQREYVWDINDKVALIESIFLGVEIGKILLCKNEKNLPPLPYYEVIDGKQRLRALMDFMENRFPFRGVYFRELFPKNRFHFENFSIQKVEYHDLTLREKILVFARVNRHGKAMDQKYIDRALEMLDENR